MLAICLYTEAIRAKFHVATRKEDVIKSYSLQMNFTMRSKDDVQKFNPKTWNLVRMRETAAKRRLGVKPKFTSRKESAANKANAEREEKEDLTKALMLSERNPVQYLFDYHLRNLDDYDGLTGKTREDARLLVDRYCELFARLEDYCDCSLSEEKLPEAKLESMALVREALELLPEAKVAMATVRENLGDASAYDIYSKNSRRVAEHHF
jgi:hypothetical protein